MPILRCMLLIVLFAHMGISAMPALILQDLYTKPACIQQESVVQPGLGQDQHLTYEKVTDVFTSQREQTHVFLTLDNGQTLQATEGHPFLTSEGWRDAILLKKGGKLLIKGEADKHAGQEAKTKAVYEPNQPLAGINTAQSATSIGAFL